MLFGTKVEFDAQLLPASLLVRAQYTARDDFSELLGSPLGVLLVRVDDVDGDLALGLADASGLPAETLPSSEGFSYGTRLQSRDEMIAPRPHVAPDVSTPRLDPLRLRTVLVKTAHFAAPLVKRVLAGKPFTSRISIGRARNNDIVLRHASVSKFHAWIENKDGVLVVGDARSTNHTKVNGTRVAKELVTLEPGSTILFGDVHTTFCTPDLLWQALRT